MEGGGYDGGGGEGAGEGGYWMPAGRTSIALKSVTCEIHQLGWSIARNEMLQANGWRWWFSTSCALAAVRLP